MNSGVRWARCPLWTPGFVEGGASLSSWGVASGPAVCVAPRAAVSDVTPEIAPKRGCPRTVGEGATPAGQGIRSQPSGSATAGPQPGLRGRRALSDAALGGSRTPVVHRYREIVTPSAKPSRILRIDHAPRVPEESQTPWPAAYRSPRQGTNSGDVVLDPQRSERDRAYQP